MSISINTKGVTIEDAYYPGGYLGFNVSGNKVNFIHLPTLRNLINGYVDFSLVVNEATGQPFASVDDLKTFSKRLLKMVGATAMGLQMILLKLHNSQ